MTAIAGRLALALATSMLTGMPAAVAVDFTLFADHASTCAYIATAPAEDVAMVEIWLTLLQRDGSTGESRDRLSVAREDARRLDGEAMTVEKAISVIDRQILEGHAMLRTMRSRVRAIDTLPEAEAAALRAERNALQAEMRATSEDLIEISFSLRDAKTRLAALRGAMAGKIDIAAMIRSTVRQHGATILGCAAARRASLAAAQR